MQRIVILGSTGSIGAQTLEVLRGSPQEFKVIGLSANHPSEAFEKQTAEFRPKHAIIASREKDPAKALCALASIAEADAIVNALAGAAGCLPTLAACRAGKKIALANKESLVMAGEQIMAEAARTGAEIVPIDSELSALHQILQGADDEAIEKVIITASGGPFLGWTRERLQNATPQQALEHPNWSMGKKVTVDSATLMNKAFEMIEAHRLFGLPMEKIEVVIHRQSIAHALVQWRDGNAQAVMSPPDMCIAIAAALWHPRRPPASFSRLFPRLDFSKLHLDFAKPDFSLFPGPRLAAQVVKQGGIMPSVFAAADEQAVRQFL
ncbi:1-deoxy-D-xylulose-5-phosphate reductoisomerase, partial [Candidatus Peregrinibacteria bacterium]|nr:1-deoxy-D-xylulose-5-phosphate reductoisomerase [Candidatus Peregrinibacteria bacterium]